MKQSAFDDDMVSGQFADKKHEGYSALDKKDQKKKRAAAKEKGGKEFENQQQTLISNLQRQVSTMEVSIKTLKSKEVQQQKNSKGYETLLADKIPLNEHFLALKNKFNTE